MDAQFLVYNSARFRHGWIPLPLRSYMRQSTHTSTHYGFRIALVPSDS